MTPEEGLPRYWKDNMVSTVRFSSAVTECFIHHPQDLAILEIGPHPALKGPAQEILRSLGKDSISYYNSCFRGMNDLEALLNNAGAMIAHGLPLKTQNINAREVVNGLQCTYEYVNVLTHLPSYQWDHSTPLWTESRTSRNQRFRQFPRHQLLGSRYLEDTPMNPSWRSFLMLSDVPWLEEVKV